MGGEKRRSQASEPPVRDMRGEVFDNWGRFDERELEQRRRANRNRTILMTALGVVFFCGFISVMLGTSQSYLVEALVALPKYPGAQRVEFHSGEDCSVTLDVYCYRSVYRTPDSSQKVIAYYEGLPRLGFLPPVKFVTEHNRRFAGDYIGAEVCAQFLGHSSCTEIALFPQGTETEIHYLEIGYPGNVVP